MQFIIGTVDGKVHKSKRISDQEVQDYINANDGRVGTGELANKRIRTVEEFIGVMSDFLKYDKKNDNQVFNMTMSNGRMRHFNVQHIAWWEVK